MSKLYRWTGAKVKWMRENMHLTDAEMAEHLGTKATTVQGARMRYGLIKEGWGRFQSGNTPHNKGGKAPWAKTKCRETQFKKGQNPHNTRKVGDRWQRTERGIAYWMVKTEDGIKYLHRWVWEQANGPVPKRHVVQFIDGNRDNCDLSNLRCLSLADAARLVRDKIDAHARAKKAWETRRLKQAKEASKPWSIAA